MKDLNLRILGAAGKGKYYITADDCENDQQLASFLKCTYKEYVNYLLKNFNGYMDMFGYGSNFRATVCFESIKDVAEAVEYIESLLVAKKLSENNNQ